MKQTKILTILFVIVALILTTKAALGMDTDVVINEIMVDPSTGNEWIELYNTGVDSVDYDALGTGFIRTNLGDTVITGKINGHSHLILELNNKLTDSGDKIVLKNSPSGFIDALTYGDYTHAAIATHTDTLLTDELISRIHDGNIEWIISNEATKNSANNRKPVGSILSQNLAEVNNELIILELTDLFSDADGDDLIYTKISQKGGVLCKVITNEQLQLKLGVNWKKDASCTISVDDSYGGVVQKTVNISVTPALEIKSLKVNGETVNSGDLAQELKPLDHVTLSVEVNNHLNYKLTGLAYKLDVNGAVVENEFNTNLNPGETKTISIDFDVPLVAVEQVFNVDLIITGKDYQNPSILRKDLFNFNLEVSKDAADIIINAVTLGQSELTCRGGAWLNIEYTNLGKNTEDDLKLLIQSGDLEIVKEVPAIDSATAALIKIWIKTEDLSEGDNTIYVKGLYRDDSTYSNVLSTTVKRNNCLLSYAPEEDTWIIGLGQPDDELSVTLAEDGFDQRVMWYVNDEAVYQGVNYPLPFDQVGEFEVYAEINGEYTQVWTYIVTDEPVSESGLIPEGYWNGSFDGKIRDPASVDEFTIENNFAKIVFDGNLDLTGILNIDEVIVVNVNKVSVDTSDNAAPELNVPATITIKKSFTNPRILRAEGFDNDASEFSTCPESICVITNNSNGQIIFTVTGFSTYLVVEDQPATIDISPIVISNVDKGKSGSVQVTIKNTGTYQSLTGLSVELLDINSKYKANFSGSVPVSLSAGQQFSLTFNFYVPEGEDSGQHQIGRINVTSNEDSSEQDIYLSPKSYLTVDNIKINGKSSGKLSLQDLNEIEIKVNNEYSEDINNVFVMVKILDVDGEDLEEESDENDIRDGDSETFTVDFDLKGETIDEDTYTLELTIEGEADDGSTHTTTEIKTVDVDLETHQVIINSASLSSSTLQCLRQTTMQVMVENIGKSNEDDVKIVVENSALDLSLSKTAIDLEKYSSGDNDYKATFNLNLEDAKAGSYPLTVKVYRDNDILEDSTDVTLELTDCYAQSSTTQAVNQYVNKDQLALQLQNELDVRKVQSQKTIASFRDTTAYTSLLTIMVALVFIAVLMGLIVSLKRKRR